MCRMERAEELGSRETERLYTYARSPEGGWRGDRSIERMRGTGTGNESELERGNWEYHHAFNDQSERN